MSDNTDPYLRVSSAAHQNGTGPLAFPDILWGNRLQFNQRAHAAISRARASCFSCYLGPGSLSLWRVETEKENMDGNFKTLTVGKSYRRKEEDRKRGQMTELIMIITDSDVPLKAYFHSICTLLNLLSILNTHYSLPAHISPPLPLSPPVSVRLPLLPSHSLWW